jgi:hypothetical protein
MIFADYCSLSVRAVVSAARTGDIVLYSSVSKEKDESHERSRLSALLSMLPCAIALSDGVRESRTRLDRVAVVIESRLSAPELLIFNQKNVLVVVPLERMIHRPICLRPLFTDNATGSDKLERSRRGAVHQLLLSAIDELTNGRLPQRTLEQAQQSSAFLTAFLLHRAAVLPIAPEKFCAQDFDDVEQLFGADTLHIDRVLLREFAYGHQIWFT